MSPVTAWWQRRHRFTLLFALSHTFHLVGVVALSSLAPSRFSLPTFVSGGLGYALIYYAAAMAFVRRNNPELSDWKMQTVILCTFWTIFTLGFVLGMRKHVWVYAPLATLMLLALVARIYARRVSTVAARRECRPRQRKGPISRGVARKA